MSAQQKSDDLMRALATPAVIVAGVIYTVAVVMQPAEPPAQPTRPAVVQQDAPVRQNAQAQP